MEKRAFSRFVRRPAAPDFSREMASFTAMAWKNAVFCVILVLNPCHLPTKEGVTALICGGIGGGARAALAEAGIALYPGAAGDADAAAAALLAGTAEPWEKEFDELEEALNILQSRVPENEAESEKNKHGHN